MEEVTERKGEIHTVGWGLNTLETLISDTEIDSQLR